MDELIKLVQRHWRSPLGLVAAIALLSLIAVALLEHLAPAIVAAASVLACACVVLIWIHARSIRKNPKDRIGVMVAIQCSDEAEEARVREDFVGRIRSLVSKGASSSRLNFIEVPKHLSNTLTDDSAVDKLRRKANAHFVLHGHVRLRNFDGRQHHVIDIRGLVAHKELEKSVQNRFRQEFAELMPARVTFPEENDLLAFEFTAELTDIVSRYVIGLAAALSGDVASAERMYVDVSRRLSGVDKQFPVLEKIRTRLPFRMFELNEARAVASYEKWRRHKTKENAQALGRYLAAIPVDADYARRVLSLRAVHAVVDLKDIALAREYVLRHDLRENAIWHFNLAFLAAFDGKLRKAVKHYQDGARTVVEEETIADIEEFMTWILREEPSKYQFHYCLGFFNWKVRGDLALASSDFKVFLRSGDERQFVAERKLARKWLTQIEEQLGRSV